MDMATQPRGVGEEVVQTISHVNLHYRRNTDGPVAARLLELLGLVKTQELTLPNGSAFYRFTVNRNDPNRGDGIVYLGVLPAALSDLTEAIREALGVDTERQHPAVTEARAAQARDPEQNFHVGFLVSSLEAVEARMAELKRLSEMDPQLKGRLKFLVNRAVPGNPAVDARLDASPLYRDVTRYTYGKNGVQAFVETDLVVSGPLADGIVFELDYVFPGYDEHIMSISELTR
jgi:hypothetical protein